MMVKEITLLLIGCLFLFGCGNSPQPQETKTSEHSSDENFADNNYVQKTVEYDVDEVINKYYEANGLKNYDKVKSLKYTGSFITRDNEYPIIVYLKAPNKLRYDIFAGNKSLGSGWLVVPSLPLYPKSVWRTRGRTVLVS